MEKPFDSGTPIPPAPFDLTSLLEALKVLVIVLIILAGQGASQAFSTVIDYSKINDAGFLSHLLLTTYHGFLAGCINGIGRSLQIVMAIWAGPTVWKYLGPILVTAGTTVSVSLSRFASLFKKETPALKSVQG